VKPTTAALLYQRGQLVERIAHQRVTLARELAPVQSVLGATDQAVAAARSGLQFLKEHPLVLTVAVAMLALFKPRRTLRLLSRGFVVWRAWRLARTWAPKSLWQFLARRYF
jgi:YqjK-like protein